LRLDYLSFFGLLLGIGGILVGQALEGGHASSLVNLPALFIVLGGTLGATLLQTRLATFALAMRMLAWIFRPPAGPSRVLIQRVVAWSQTARKEGLLGLENLAESEPDPYVQKGMHLLVDGSEPEVIRKVLEMEVDVREGREAAAARVFESMGGYSPTIGIIGAVMGLIHVMGNLADPSTLGGGIAVAFVATIYGVGLANLVFLPFASKLKALVQHRSLAREMVIEGLIAIAEGENPRLIETRLTGYLE
jgi:chemotaxis protein MotA